MSTTPADPTTPASGEQILFAMLAAAMLLVATLAAATLLPETAGVAVAGAVLLGALGAIGVFVRRLLDDHAPAA
jgi:hypothetical protein